MDFELRPQLPLFAARVKERIREVYQREESRRLSHGCPGPELAAAAAAAGRPAVDELRNSRGSAGEPDLLRVGRHPVPVWHHPHRPLLQDEVLQRSGGKSCETKVWRGCGRRHLHGSDSSPPGHI